MLKKNKQKKHTDVWWFFFILKTQIKDQAVPLDFNLLNNLFIYFFYLQFKGQLAVVRNKVGRKT